MKVEDRYNRIIEHIETEVKNYELIPIKDIAIGITNLEGMSFRDINMIFNYITGKSIINYVRERKMINTYGELISDDEFEIEKYIVMSEYDNQSSFTKKFSEMFGISPKKAFEKKDGSLVTKPLYWSNLSMINREETFMNSTCLFGIEIEKMNEYNTARDMQELYEFDDNMAELAYQISKEYQMKMRRAFEFVDENIKLEGEYDFLVSFSENDPAEKIFEGMRAKSDWLITAFKNYPEWSISEIDEYSRMLKTEGYDFFAEEPFVIRVYYEDKSPACIEEIRDYYAEYCNKKGKPSSFEEFSKYVIDGENDKENEGLSDNCEMSDSYRETLSDQLERFLDFEAPNRDDWYY